jgi:formate-dependent nitrite reductase cytochrome c552 subunit
VELFAFAVVLGAVAAVLVREAIGRRGRGVAAIVCGTLVAATYLGVTARLSADDEKAPAANKSPVPNKFVKPDNWPKGHPLPLVESNCATCHLTAGRELTGAVINFTRSVHDLQHMSCSDCHGGNTEDDVSAHKEEFGFIGTKKSAHIEHCSECHDEEAKVLASGPHAWDFSKKINTEFPMCFDCHGNHDIGNPPADFELAAWCADCHDKPEKEFPNLAAVVAGNDQLWGTLRKVHKRNIESTENPVPEPFRKEVDSLRHATMHAIHKSVEISPEQAEKLNQRADALRKRLDEWLQLNP